MSDDLAIKIRLGLDQLSTVREGMEELIAKPPEYDAGTIETAAACAMLHSFYTEIGENHEADRSGLRQASAFLGGVAQGTPKSNAASTDTRPAVFDPSLVEVLGEYLAFRHLFRGASIVLMRWNKLRPLIAKVDGTHRQVRKDLEGFCEFLQSQNPAR